MSIKTIGEMREVLNNYSSVDWAKSADIGASKKTGLEQAPVIPFENGDVQKTFGEFLTDSVAKVNSMQLEANDAIEKLVTGKSKNIHETLLAVEKADLAFRTMNQIRSKVLDAYREIMKMQI